jgi:hypothetical protein
VALALPLGVGFVYAEPESAYSLVEWVAAPGARARRCTSTEQPTKRVLRPGRHVRLPGGSPDFGGKRGGVRLCAEGLEHAFWNGGTTSARSLSTVSLPGFERYFEELGEGLAAAGDDAEADTSLRKALSEEHDIEVLGPPRQATG